MFGQAYKPSSVVNRFAIDTNFLQIMLRRRNVGVARELIQIAFVSIREVRRGRTEIRDNS
jgi:hypothetical protein